MFSWLDLQARFYILWHFYSKKNKERTFFSWYWWGFLKSLICFALLYFAFLYHYLYILIPAGCLFGGFIFPIMPSTMELITRNYSDFPLHISNVFMMTSSQLLTVFLQFIVGILMNNKNEGGSYTMIFVFCFLSLSFIFVPFVDIEREKN